MQKFPEKKEEIEIGAIGKVTIFELPIKYRLDCLEDPAMDTQVNTLIQAGIPQEDVMKIGEQVIAEVYKAIMRLTYPRAYAELEKQIEDGTYEEPTEVDNEESKKN